MDLTLRPAVAGDLPAVGALHQRSRVAAYRDLVPAEALAAISPESMGRWWTERWPYERETHLLTVAERDGSLAGFTYVGPAETGEPDVGELYAIHLDPLEQGRGVGRALMIDALATLHGRGWRHAVLWVLAGNERARRFYERGGWRPDGVERQGNIGPAVTRQLRYRRDLP
ncbi:GNAT family N-acetyltransferase [Micromonospora sp. NPDC049559]|uniref:GNAT family N-acetyltransferase n=1 Tax=Micromonospora sp. NPDC049559 TaxID=3155923 RepID=UPI00341A2B8F